jgi:hypothetical protein
VVAAGYVSRWRTAAVGHLRNEQAIADQNGDDLSSEAWGDIAHATELILLHRN